MREDPQSKKHLICLERFTTKKKDEMGSRLYAGGKQNMRGANLKKRRNFNQSVKKRKRG